LDLESQGVAMDGYTGVQYTVVARLIN
jgi:hypothetical protein